MDSSEEYLDRIEAQRSTNVTPDQRKRRYFLVNLIKRGISRILRPLCLFQAGVERRQSVRELFANLELSDLFAFSGVYAPMSPEIFSAVSEGKSECMLILRSSGTPMACLKSDQGDSILHLAAAWGHVELVKRIASECPCLLLELDWRDQLPLHVAARAGHASVVQVLTKIVTFVSARMSDNGMVRLDPYEVMESLNPYEGMESLNPYVLKNKDGDTALHLAVKYRNGMSLVYLGKAYLQASFLANNEGTSPLFIAVQDGQVGFVKYLLGTSENDGLDLQLEGRKDLLHVALKARNSDMVDVILEKYPSLENERDEEGMTCFSVGASVGFYKGVCKLLDRSTRSVYECNDDGSFPIHIAVQKGHMGVVFALLIRCPDSKHLLNRKGQNILHIASKSGNAALFLFLLLDRTIKVQLMEKQDVDGNTPLHLATINWRPRTLFFLLFHFKGKCINTKNNDGRTALGIAESNLQPNYIFMERVTLMVLLYFYASSRGSTWLMFKKKITRRTDPPPAGDRNKGYVNTLLVVSALVATVTFAAGFTIPGGFNSSQPNMGLPTLASDRRLIYFMVFNILAMQSSIVTIATLIWAQLGDPALVHRSINVALPSLFFALLCMWMAFYCGVFVVFARIKGLVIFLNVTSAIFIFLMLFLLGPHVILRIPGIPAAFGAYFVLFVLLVDDNHHEQASTAKISSKEASAVKISGKEASAVMISGKESSASQISLKSKEVPKRKSFSI